MDDIRPVAPTAFGSVSSYRSRLIFKFPNDIFNHTSERQSYGFKWDGGIIWEIIPGAARTHFLPFNSGRSNHNRFLQFSVTANKELPEFSSTPCIYTIQPNGIIICKLAEKAREYIPQPRGSGAYTKKKPSIKYNRPLYYSEVLREGQDILTAIEKFAAKTGYKIHQKEDGFWCWRAPEIISPMAQRPLYTVSEGEE
jgi:hypothetical protein